MYDILRVYGFILWYPMENTAAAVGMSYLNLYLSVELYRGYRVRYKKSSRTRSLPYYSSTPTSVSAKGTTFFENIFATLTKHRLREQFQLTRMYGALVSAVLSRLLHRRLHSFLFKGVHILHFAFAIFQNNQSNFVIYDESYLTLLLNNINVRS